jgi:bifunctional enzyme CysN/CysC
MAVTVRLEDNLDVSRGDMICRPSNRPTVGQDISAMICWMSESSQLQPRQKLAIKHTTRVAKAMIKDINYKVDVTTLHRDESINALGLNDIGRVSLRTTAPLFYDEYRRNRITGSFILIDEVTGNTVGAGMTIPNG